MTFVLEVIGTITFAFAGAFVAIDYDLDWLGIVLMGCCTACGGGMTRDIIIGNTPPMLFRNPIYVSMAVVVAFITMAIYRPLMKSKYKETILFTINVFDAIGLAVFTVVGMNTAASVGFRENAFLVCFCGVMSAVGGGLLRDIMVNRTPIILSKDIYATAAIAGSIVYHFAWIMIGQTRGAYISMIVIFRIRIWAMKNKKNLPYVSKEDLEVEE